MIGKYQYFYYVGESSGNMKAAMFRGDVALVSLRANSRKEADLLSSIWSDIGRVTFGWSI
jgi:hypothetical protein